MHGLVHAEAEIEQSEEEIEQSEEEIEQAEEEIEQSEAGIEQVEEADIFIVMKVWNHRWTSVGDHFRQLSSSSYQKLEDITLE